MVFGEKPSLDYALDFKKNDDIHFKSAEDNEKKLTLCDRTKVIFNELIKLYGPEKLRRRVIHNQPERKFISIQDIYFQAIIAHFCWCVTSLSYYVLGNVYIYVFF